MTSRFQPLVSGDGTEILDTLNTNNFNSKIYTSVQEENLSGAVNQTTEGVFNEFGSSKMMSI